VLERIGAVDVRCLIDFSLEPASGTNLLVGDNGAGKTSVLESMFLLGRGRSFRAANLASVASTGKTAFAIRGRVSSEEQQRVRTVGLKWTQGRTTGQIDSRDAESLAELARAFPVEVIDTQVQEIVRGGPGQRRRYLDWGVFHVEHVFIDAWRRYSRALKQRNAALRQPSGISMAKAWEEELSVSGTLLNEARSRYVERLVEDVGDVVEDLLGAPISVTYAKGWPEAMTLAEALDRGRERDAQRGATSVGPHRADLEICWTDSPHASTPRGASRSCSRARWCWRRFGWSGKCSGTRRCC
jgi:DNA replication and repair protein RecF